MDPLSPANPSVGLSAPVSSANRTDQASAPTLEGWFNTAKGSDALISVSPPADYRAMDPAQLATEVLDSLSR